MFGEEIESDGEDNERFKMMYPEPGFKDTFVKGVIHDRAKKEKAALPQTSFNPFENSIASRRLTQPGHSLN